MFDSDALPECDRTAALSSTLSGAETPQSVTFNSDGLVHHRMEIFEFGSGVHMLRNKGTALHVVRSPRHVRLGTRDELAVFVQTRGRAFLTGHGGDSFLRPGQLGAVDVTRPYAVRQFGDSDVSILLIEFDQLGLPVDVIRAAIPSLAASPICRLIQGHLRNLTVDLPPDVAAVTGRATADLIAALVTTASGDPRRHELLEVTEPIRIADYIDEHLGDPGLTAGQIATAHGMSVRRLTALWGKAYDATPADWIARLRLERAWRLLTDLEQASATVDDIAGVCGFSDVRHFGQRFRASYGMSPEQRRAPRSVRTPAEETGDADPGQ